MTVTSNCMESKLEIEQNPCDELETDAFTDGSGTTNPNNRVSNRSQIRKKKSTSTTESPSESRNLPDPTEILSHTHVEERESSINSSRSATLANSESNSRPMSIFAQSLLSTSGDWVDGLSSVSSITSNVSSLSTQVLPESWNMDSAHLSPARLRRRKKLERFMKKLGTKRQMEAKRYILLLWAERVLVRQQFRYLILRAQGIVKYTVLVSWIQLNASRSLRAVAYSNFVQKALAKALRGWSEIRRRSRSGIQAVQAPPQAE